MLTKLIQFVKPDSEVSESSKEARPRGIRKLYYLVSQYQYPLFISACIALISFTSYNLGKINALQKVPIKIGESDMWSVDGSKIKADIFQASNNIPHSILSPQKKLDTRVVVSKASNSKKYHYTWCPGALKIKETNKIWFKSAQGAESSGYTLAGNCKK